MLSLNVPDRVRSRYESSGWWTGDRLINHIERTVSERPDSRAVVDETHDVSYGEIWEMGKHLAGWLASRGVQEGTIVSVQLPNWWEFALVHVATEILGAAINPLLPIYGEKELRHILATCESRVLVVPQRHSTRDSYVEAARRLQEELPELNGVLVVRAEDEFEPSPGVVSLKNALEHEPVECTPGVSADSPTLVAFTSGTESLAKGCVHTSNTTLFALRTAVRELELDHRDVVFMASPLGHATGINWGLRLAFLLGTSLVLQDKWDAAVACRLIGEHRCTYSLSATPFIRELVDHVKSGCADADFSSFRMFVSGGASIPRALVQEANEILGADLLACFGQAETWMVSLVRPHDPWPVKSGSDGRLMPYVDVVVTDEVGRPVPAGERGECWTRGPHVMIGYLNPPPGYGYEPGGWWKTGDFVTVDDDGVLTVVGRKKEIIIRGGMNISPAEVEEILLSHPDVSRVAVVGYPDRRLGERACAVVVPKPGVEPTLESLTQHMRDLGCAVYKLPERLLVVETFPMTPSGKVQKIKLKELLAVDGSLVTSLGAAGEAS